MNNIFSTVSIQNVVFSNPVHIPGHKASYTCITKTPNYVVSQ